MALVNQPITQEEIQSVLSEYRQCNLTPPKVGLASFRHCGVNFFVGNRNYPGIDGGCRVIVLTDARSNAAVEFGINVFGCWNVWKSSVKHTQIMREIRYRVMFVENRNSPKLSDRLDPLDVVAPPASRTWFETVMTFDSTIVVPLYAAICPVVQRYAAVVRVEPDPLVSAMFSLAKITIAYDYMNWEP